MNDLKRLLRRQLPWLVPALASNALMALFLWLAQPDSFQGLIGAMLLSLLLIYSAIIAGLYRAAKRRSEAFIRFLELSDEAHYRNLDDACRGTLTPELTRLKERLQTLHRQSFEALNRLRSYEDYIELWAHEIKLPLSLLTLVIDNHRDSLPEAVLPKLNFIQNEIREDVEQILFDARLRSDRRDYSFEPLSLAALIDDALCDFAPLLDEAGFVIRNALAEADDSPLVFSDRRSLDFILRQLLSNTLKYRSETPALDILYETDETKTVLTVSDNGRGTAACDLPFIFERGFSGDSKQARKQATGMGLYLVKCLTDDLSIGLNAASEPGLGFAVTMTFFNR